MAEEEKFTNHLIEESSPYLQQHAHNPVDWYPWGKEAFSEAKKEIFSQTVIETLNYILREMSHSKGGFFSAEDADSEGVEGKYYSWTKKEIKAILGKNAHKFCRYYNVTDDGNFDGKNVLHSILEVEEFEHPPFDLKSCKKKLLKERDKRVHPFKDDKIICSWNGLMIFSLAHAGAALEKSEYLKAAIKAATFIQAHLSKEGQLIRCWREGEGDLPSDLDGYAFTIRAALALFQTGQGTKWLKWAIELSQVLSHSFKANEDAFYMTNGQDPHLLLRKCQFSDAAEPSGNAIHCENLLTLYQITGDPNYLTEAEDILKAVKKHLESYPLGYLYHIRNLQRYFDRKAPHLILTGNEKKEELLKAIYSQCLPHKTVTWVDDELIELLPNFSKYKVEKSKTTLHLCIGQTCEKVVVGIDKLLKRISDI